MYAKTRTPINIIPKQTNIIAHFKEYRDIHRPEPQPTWDISAKVLNSKPINSMNARNFSGFSIIEELYFTGDFY